MCFFFYLCNLHTVFIAFRKQNEKKETLHSLCEMADHGKVDDIVCKVNTYLHTKYIRRYVMKIKKKLFVINCLMLCGFAVCSANFTI